MKGYLTASVLMLALFASPTASSAMEEIHYTDVGEFHMYADGIDYMTDQGFVEGYPSGAFAPMSEVSRVEALKMILESSGRMDEQAQLVVDADFPDVDPSEWYMDYIDQGLALGIVSGDDDGTFRPTDPVNRAEALKMWALANNVETYELGNESDWYEPFLNYGISEALLLPEAPQEYSPEANMVRGELCDMIYRDQEDPLTGEIEFGVASYYSYSFDGANTASGQALNAYGFQAAHISLPFGTQVRVTNPSTNKSVDVTIVDRGPYVDGRVIDLTPAAFDAIGHLGAGLYQVTVEVLEQNE